MWLDSAHTRVMKIVLPGGSGHVGQSLRKHFASQGHEVVVLSRSGGVRWDGKTLGDWVKVFEGADVVINLAGRSVDCRYNAENLAEMMSSRVDSTRVVGEAIRQCAVPPKLWIQSSTATIYSHRFDAPNDDEAGILGQASDPMPTKWLKSVEIAREWERALNEAETPQTRKVAIRSAMVMAPIKGSVFHVLSKLARLGLMGRLGDGRQFVSWIHESDFCRSIDWIIEHDSLVGPVIVASPNPLPQVEFARALRHALGVKIGLPATAWMLEIGTRVMQTESELVLKSRRVVPSRLIASGFQFEFPEWASAAEDLARQSQPSSARAH